MGPDHEYALLSGINRSKIGRVLGMVAGGISSVIVLGVLALVDLAKSLGVASYVPQLILWPLGAGTVYLGLYWLFNRHLWKISLVNRLLKLPNLAGDWRCEGQTINPDRSLGHPWQGTITITQSWDLIKIRLKTKQSHSRSIAAALIHDEADGYRVMYHYLNTPNIDEPELNVHRGFSELTFASDCQTALGEYFNGQGRFTFGTMKLTRL